MNLILICTLSLILPRFLIFLTTIRVRFTSRMIPPSRIAVILGAGLEKDGRPTRVLRERIETAVDLLRRGNVQTLLLSGGNPNIYANETEAMRLYALELGVPNERMLIDPDGFRTFDSCMNLTRFGTNQVTLITQSFHLPRAVWIARALGVNAIGCTTPHHVEHWDDEIIWQLRELAASIRAILDIGRIRLTRLARPNPSPNRPDTIHF